MSTTRYIADLPRNRYCNYKFELWQEGYKIYEKEYDNLNDARKFYANHGQCDSYAIKLFVNGKLINFMEMSHELRISRNDRWRLDLAF